MTNEQSVIAAEKKITQLKKDYILFLQPITLRLHQTKGCPSLEEFLTCQQLGNQLFNFLESFVGNSGLLGAHANGKWVTGFAEHCHSALKAYIVHLNFLRSHQSVLGVANIEPDTLAFANMQRMVKEYLPKEISDSLEIEFKKNSLPTQGFTMSAHEDEKKVPVWQLITSISIGVLCVLGVVLLSVMIPNPTEWQGFVFRGCLALGLAAIVAIVPGFININARIKGFSSYMKVVAGGAIAIFVLIWLVNPPSMQSAQNNASLKVNSPTDNPPSL